MGGSKKSLGGVKEMNEQESEWAVATTTQDGQGEINDWKDAYKTFLLMSFCDAGRIQKCQVVFVDDENKLRGEMAEFQKQHKDTGCGCRICALEPEELKQVARTLRNAQRLWRDMHESG
jgi:major membrane immunogen (membrane-anchored lipoprotein)